MTEKQEKEIINLTTEKVKMDFSSTNGQFFQTTKMGEYQSISRLLLKVDELNAGDLPRYERDISVKSYVIPKRADCPQCIIEGEELLIPTFEIASYPTWTYKELNRRSGINIADRAIARAKDSIKRQEDVEVLKVINAAVPSEHQHTCYQNDITSEGLLKYMNDAILDVAEHELNVSYIISHPRGINDLNLVSHKHLWKNMDSDHNPQTGAKHWGNFLGIPILTTIMCPKNAIYVTANPELLGAFVVRRDMTESEIIKDALKLREGVVVSEEIGVGVINDYAVSRILLYGSKPIAPVKVTIPRKKSLFDRILDNVFANRRSLEESEDKL